MSDLPLEIWEHILSRFIEDHLVLYRLQSVSRFFNTLIQQSSDLQYKIALAKEGMKDGPASNATPKERLDLLKKRSLAWEKLDWTVLEIRLPAAYGFWELSGNIYGYVESHDTLNFTQLPSRFSGRTLKQWTIPVEPHGDFTFDPSQDILALVGDTQGSPHISLRSVTTGDFHPLASSPEIFHSFRSSAGLIKLKIFGDLLAVLFTQVNARPHLGVWNWKTGLCLMSLDEGPHDCSFLTEALMVFLVLEGDGNGGSDLTMRIIDLNATQSSASTMEELHTLTKLLFPRASWISQIPEIFPEAATCGPATGIPFANTISDRLLATYFRASIGSDHVLLVPFSTLLRWAKPSDEPGGRVVEWAEWGPTGARLLPITLPWTWIRFVHGLKFIHYDPARDEMCLYDFRQSFLQPSAGASGDGMDSFGWKVVEQGEPSRGCPAESASGLPPATLPYRKKTIPLAKMLREQGHDKRFVPGAVMISEDCVLVVPRILNPFAVLSF